MTNTEPNAHPRSWLFCVWRFRVPNIQTQGKMIMRKYLAILWALLIISGVLSQQAHAQFNGCAAGFCTSFAVGRSALTVFSSSTFSGDSGDTGITARSQITPSAGSSGTVSVTVQAGAATTTAGASSICVDDGSSTGSCAATPTPLTWSNCAGGGGSSFSIATNGSCQSDYITFGYTNGQTVNVCIDSTSDKWVDVSSPTIGSTAAFYWKASATSCSTQTVAGYSFSGGHSFSVSQIQTK